MSDLFHRVRLWADVRALIVPNAPDWPGIENGFRSDFEVAGVTHFSAVIDSPGVIAPGLSGNAKFDVLNLLAGEVTVGTKFTLRRGPKIAAEGVVMSIESSEVMS
jgi:hypothetical protein